VRPDPQRTENPPHQEQAQAPEEHTQQQRQPQPQPQQRPQPQEAPQQRGVAKAKAPQTTREQQKQQPEKIRAPNRQDEKNKQGQNPGQSGTAPQGIRSTKPAAPAIPPTTNKRPVNEGIGIRKSETDEEWAQIRNLLRELCMQLGEDETLFLLRQLVKMAQYHDTLWDMIPTELPRDDVRELKDLLYDTLRAKKLFIEDLTGGLESATQKIIKDTVSETGGVIQSFKADDVPIINQEHRFQSVEQHVWRQLIEYVNRIYEEISKKSRETGSSRCYFYRKIRRCLREIVRFNHLESFMKKRAPFMADKDKGTDLSEKIKDIFHRNGWDSQNNKKLAIWLDSKMKATKNKMEEEIKKMREKNAPKRATYRQTGVNFNSNTNGRRNHNNNYYNLLNNDSDLDAQFGAEETRPESRPRIDKGKEKVQDPPQNDYDDSSDDEGPEERTRRRTTRRAQNTRTTVAPNQYGASVSRQFNVAPVAPPMPNGEGVTDRIECNTAAAIVEGPQPQAPETNAQQNQPMDARSSAPEATNIEERPVTAERTAEIPEATQPPEGPTVGDNSGRPEETPTAQNEKSDPPREDAPSSNEEPELSTTTQNAPPTTGGGVLTRARSFQSKRVMVDEGQGDTT
jgi:hypothetical protein